MNGLPPYKIFALKTVIAWKRPLRPKTERSAKSHHKKAWVFVCSSAGGYALRLAAPAVLGIQYSGIISYDMMDVKMKNHLYIVTVQDGSSSWPKKTVKKHRMSIRCGNWYRKQLTSKLDAAFYANFHAVLNCYSHIKKTRRFHPGGPWQSRSGCAQYLFLVISDSAG